MSDVRTSKFVDSWVLTTGHEKRIPSLESVGEIAIDFSFIPLSSLKVNEVTFIYLSLKFCPFRVTKFPIIFFT